MSEVLAVRRRFAEEIRERAGLRSPALVRAFAEVPRESFLPPGPWSVWNMETMSYEPTADADAVHVYCDAPVGIRPERLLNNGQPSFVGRLIDELELGAGDSVAHVGAGSGYFTAVLAATVGPSGSVTAVELDEELASRARENLLPWPHATVVNADGCEHDLGDVDAILINAGASAPRPRWLDGLRAGGRLVVPLVRWPAREEERGASGIGIVLKVTRGDQEYAARVIGPVVIFPCIGGIDAEADRSLADALRRPEHAEAVRSLRRDRHEREATCWLHGEEYCISRLPPGGRVETGS